MKKTQTTLNQFLALSSESDSSEESEYELSKQKSALSIPDQWTRVRSRAQMKQSKVTIFDISKDFDSDKALKTVRRNSAKPQNQNPLRSKLYDLNEKIHFFTPHYAPYPRERRDRIKL